ncbi:MAG TPA: PIG-L family deacetylase [Candidatus Acidoferrales bacterium]|nr:PIG-L family deacetylase [Candidatus Acidoferrales bacterium]
MASRCSKILPVTFAVLVCAVPFLFRSNPLRAQSPNAVSSRPIPAAEPLDFDRGAAALWQSLLKLHTRASLIMVTAHPDDEDGGMLTYESRGQGVRAALLTLNRGEGGANVMSSDYFDALGLVRTEELLAAGRYYGVQQFFSRMCDYGFSKTKEEALEKWGHDQTLSDVVRVIRMTRPLVITSVFVGGRTDGHGNHQVAGQMAQEAFKAAGNPAMFPEQIKEGLRPWKPLKDYALVPFSPVTDKGILDYADGKYYPAEFRNYTNGTVIHGALSTSVEIPEGEYNPFLGLTYTQFARVGLGYQKSQSGGTGLPPAEAEMTPYHRFASLVSVPEKESSFFDGIDVSLAGIASLAQGGDSSFLKADLSQINSLVDKAMNDFSAQHPEAIASTLAASLKQTNELINKVASSDLTADSKYDVTHELKVKQAQFENALAESLGISVMATVVPEQEPTGPFARFFRNQPTFQVAIPGQEFWVSIHATNPTNLPVELQSAVLEAPPNEDWSIDPSTQTGGTLRGNQSADLRFTVHAAADAGFTRPYFTRPNIEQAYYDIEVPKDLSLPLAPYPLSASVHFVFDGAPFELAQVVQSVQRITGPGTVLEPLITGPAISVSIAPQAGIVPLYAKSFEVSVNIHSNVKGPAKGIVKLDLPDGWKAPQEEFSTSKDGDDQTLNFRVTPTGLKEKAYAITAVATYDGHDYKEGYHTVGYPGLRPYNLYRASTYRTTGVDVKVAPGLNIGYIVGAGDDMPESLVNLGINVHYLTAEDLASANLSKFNAIILGVRAYAVRDDLKIHNDRILEYVKNGGVVIVQYNTPEYDHNYGPYPYKMGSNPEEVTDENSQVEILAPSNPVFTWPNKITSKDFENWVEERGSKFLESWDSQYVPLLETHDPGQAPQKGGLVYAKYGKGIYIYNAYAFYRQMPEGVPGAYRIFANMVSLGKNPEIMKSRTAGTRKPERKSTR